MDALYDKAIMRLAAEANGAGRLPAPSGTATVSNPMCGDRVTIDIETANGTITKLAHEAKACLLCQASASLLCRAAPGGEADKIARLATQIESWLKDNTALPTDAWPELAVFGPVAGARSHPADGSAPRSAGKHAELKMEKPEFQDELNAMLDAIATALGIEGPAAATAVEQGRLEIRFAEVEGERVLLASYDGRMVEVGADAIRAALLKRQGAA
jgi:nitrogen fixation NifU-like protein